MLAFNASAWCQSTTAAPLGNYPYSYAWLDTEEADDTLRLQLNLGTPQQTVSDVAGYQLTLYFAPGTATPGYQAVQVADSWVGNTSEGILSSNWDATQRTLRIDYVRDPLDFRTDEGLLATILLLPDDPTSSFVLDSVGGIVLIEDAGFKRDPVTTARDVHPVRVYPNPATTEAYVDAGTVEIRALALRDVYGNIVRSLRSLPGKKINLQGLAPGIYFLEVHTGARRKIVRLQIRGSR